MAPGPSRVTLAARGRTMRAMRRWFVVLAGLGAGMVAGCLLELDVQRSCGDGYHDPRFEECDPGDDESIPRDCSCDPESCALSCCGDGIIDAEEQCEGTNWKTRPPCQGWTCENCQVVCPRCGNGQLDYGEECDFEFEAISTMPTSCDVVSVPGHPDERYEPGGSPTCRADCRWDRSTCNLCGNGKLDDQISDPTTGVINVPERCDGELFNLSDRFERCLAVCGEEGRDCKATCGESCLEIDVDPGNSDCCVRPDYPRAAGVPCCCELPEGEVPEYCSDVFDPPRGGGGPTAPVCPG